MTTPNTKWRSYLCPTPITNQDIMAAERALGVSFPAEFVSLLLEYQGCSSDPGVVRDGNGKTRHVGHLMILSEADGSRSENIVDWTVEQRSRGYPMFLVPFASTGGAHHFAMHFGDDECAPRVVFVFPDGESESTGYWKWISISESFDEFLRGLDKDIAESPG